MSLIEKNQIFQLFKGTPLFDIEYLTNGIR